MTARRPCASALATAAGPLVGALSSLVLLAAVVAAKPPAAGAAPLAYVGVWIVVDSGQTQLWGGADAARQRAVDIFAVTERYFGVSRNGSVTPARPTATTVPGGGGYVVNGTAGYPLAGPSHPEPTSALPPATEAQRLLEASDLTERFDLTVAVDGTGIGNVDQLQLRLYHVWVTTLVASQASESAEATLARFCRWAQLTKAVTTNDNVSSSVRPDAAVLLTAGPLRTLDGDFRHLGGMAYPASGCTNAACALLAVSGDDTADGVAIAHQLGHVYGAPHDGATDICGDVEALMTVGDSFGNKSRWSTCSVQRINHHLQVSQANRNFCGRDLLAQYASGDASAAAATEGWTRRSASLATIVAGTLCLVLFT